MTVTPHDIAQLAFIRATNPKLALELATASGKQADELTRKEKTSA